MKWSLDVRTAPSSSCSAARRASFASLANRPGNLGDSRFDQLANEYRWQTCARRESNRPSARIVSDQIRLECRHRGAAHRMKGTVVGRTSEAGDQLPVQAEGWHPVADALLGFGCRGMDGSSHLLQRGAVGGRQAGQILIDGMRLRRHESPPSQAFRPLSFYATALAQFLTKHQNRRTTERLSRVYAEEDRRLESACAASKPVPAVASRGSRAWPGPGRLVAIETVDGRPRSYHLA